jgi:hypothetical protein
MTHPRPQTLIFCNPFVGQVGNLPPIVKSASKALCLQLKRLVTLPATVRLIHMMKPGLLSATICLASIALAQEPVSRSETAERDPKVHTSAKRDVGSGAADIGKGAAKGAGSAAKGTGKAAVDLVTIHPINAATDLGKGAVSTGKNVGVGTAKGTGKILKGTGKAIKHIF